VYDSRAEIFTAAGITPDKQPPTDIESNQSFDMTFWAKPVDRLVVPEMPPQAINRNMQGRKVVGRWTASGSCGRKPIA